VGERVTRVGSLTCSRESEMARKDASSRTMYSSSSIRCRFQSIPEVCTSLAWHRGYCRHRLNRTNLVRDVQFLQVRERLEAADARDAVAAQEELLQLGQAVQPTDLTHVVVVEVEVGELADTLHVLDSLQLVVVEVPHLEVEAVQRRAAVAVQARKVFGRAWQVSARVQNTASLVWLTTGA
jgi:hypothetical protein